MTTKILSIDVGYSNMAIVELDTNFNDFTVKSIHKVNLFDFNEKEVHLSMVKFMINYETLLKSADIILIERQPPQGLTNIQDVIAYNYSKNVKLICPRSIHKHFMISKLDYDLRKKYTVKLTEKYLNNFEEFEKEERKHDIADAFCQALYYIEKNKINEPVVLEIPKDLNDFFDSFKYKSTQ